MQRRHRPKGEGLNADTSQIMSVLRPLPRHITQPISVAVLLAWAGVMAVVVNRSYLSASSAALATDLAQYGSAAEWRGVYYRGEKIGFTVSQMVTTKDGFELQEDGRLQMSLLGATSAATVRTRAQVDSGFALRAFQFSLDPGTGPIEVNGALSGTRLALSVTSAGQTRTEIRELPEPPALSINLSRRLANGGLVPGARHRWTVFDPATLHNAPVVVDVGKRELVRGPGRPIPAFRVEMEFSGLRTTSWVTDTGEVIREESPLGLITVREPAATAQAMAVPSRIQSDLLEAAAVVPITKERIDEPRDVRRLRIRLDGADIPGGELDGSGQAVIDAANHVIEIRDPQTLGATQGDPTAAQFVVPEPLIESDDPAIRAEAARAVSGVTGSRARVERLTRYVNGLLEKKPTMSIPSAREVLRTKVGDCNEHTALFVAMARALGIPARIDVGLVFVRGAFYYHAWPEVYIDEGHGRGLWLPVDPTLNQFPADATHVRLARGGLEKQTVILPLVGRLKMTILDLELAPNSHPILAGNAPADLGALAIPLPRRKTCCACAR
jgi:transglutaminase-like putative cysteine protease